MKKTVAIIVSILIFTVAGGLILANKGCVDPNVKKPYEQKDLHADQIINDLLNGNDEQKQEARDQIGKLDGETKIDVLLKLSKNDKVNGRMIAVSEMLTLKDPRIKTRLAEMAKSDPDEDIREAAEMAD